MPPIMRPVWRRDWSRSIFLPDEADPLEFVLIQAEKSTKWHMP